MHPMPSLDLMQYRALVEHSPTMVWRAGLDTRCDYFNATWLAFTGRKDIIEAHGGKLSLQRKVGNGTTVTLTLPVGGQGA